MAALAAEQRPDLFNGALAACGPVGDFAAQIDYLGDFRVLFDYFFPGVIPGGAVDVPDSVRAALTRMGHVVAEGQRGQMGGSQAIIRQPRRLAAITNSRPSSPDPSSIKVAVYIVRR